MALSLPKRNLIIFTTSVATVLVLRYVIPFLQGAF